MRLLFRFIRTHWQEILVTGVFFQAVINAVFTGKVLLILATIVGGLLMLAIVFQLASSARGAKAGAGGNPAFDIPRRGLIFTVGKQKDTIEYVMKGQKPEYVGFICTPQSEYVAQEVIADYDLPPERYKKKLVEAQAVAEIQAETSLILAWMRGQGLTNADIAADITGGMTTMSVAVFSVTHEEGVDSQYVRSAFDENNRPIRGSQQAILVEHFASEL